MLWTCRGFRILNDSYGNEWFPHGLAAPAKRQSKRYRFDFVKHYILQDNFIHAKHGDKMTQGAEWGERRGAIRGDHSKITLVNIARDYVVCDTNSRTPVNNNKIQWSVEA